MLLSVVLLVLVVLILIGVLGEADYSAVDQCGGHAGCVPTTLMEWNLEFDSLLIGCTNVFRYKIFVFKYYA